MNKLQRALSAEIDPKNPWKNDRLSRQVVARDFTNLLLGIRQPFVISVNSPYGTGKSFFLNAWKADLVNQGFKTVIFNAWETDYSDDAFLAFISTFQRQLSSLNGDSDANEPTKKSISEIGKSIGGYVGKKLVPIAAKGLAKTLIKLDDGDFEVLAVIEDDIENVLTEIAVEALNQQTRVEESIQSLKRLLVEAIDLETSKVMEPERQKIIVFVDELDRCRPSYTIEVLECIKHLFSVEGLVFILGVDRDAIRGSINSVYGGVDPDSYFRKFVDLPIRLPMPNCAAFCAHLVDTFSTLETEKFTEEENWHDGIGNFKKYFALFAQLLNLSLREQEQAFTKADLIFRILSSEEKPLSEATGVAVILAEKEPELLRKFVQHELRAVDLVKKAASTKSQIKPERLLNDSTVMLSLEGMAVGQSEASTFYDEINKIEQQASWSPDDGKRVEYLRNKITYYENSMNEKGQTSTLSCITRVHKRLIKASVYLESNRTGD